MNSNDEVFINLEDVDITEDNKRLLKKLSKKVIECVETVKGKAARTRIRLDEDSDQEYELVRKKKRKPSTSKPKDPAIKWYESIRYYFKKGEGAINNGEPYLASLTKRQKNTLIKDSEMLSQELLDFSSKLKE